MSVLQWTIQRPKRSCFISWDKPVVRVMDWVRPEWICRAKRLQYSTEYPLESICLRHTLSDSGLRDYGV